jgi:tetratricopeptide (TPR) repeat protein
MPVQLHRPRGTVRAWATAALAFLAVAPFLGVLRNAFVGDDIVAIQEDHRVGEESFERFFNEPYWVDRYADPLYRPVLQATYALNHHLAGFRPASYHAVNLALHACVCLLLWRVALRAGAGEAAAFFAAALFAVHPIHVEAVSQVVGRAELLAAAGVLGALLAHPGEAHAPRRAGLAAVLFLLGLGSKENAAVFLLLAPALDLARSGRRRGIGTPVRCALAPYALYLLTAGLYLLARRHALAGVIGPTSYATQNPLYAAPSGERVLTALSLMPLAVRLLLFPVRLSADYGAYCIRLALDATDPRALAGLGCVLAALLGLVFSFRRLPPAFFALVLTIIPYVLVSNLVFPIGTVFGERLLYLPSAGAAMLGGLWFARSGRCGERDWTRMCRFVLVIASLVLMALLTVARVPDWRSSETIYQATLRVCPQSVFAHHWLGHLFLRSGRINAAIREFSTAHALMPDEPRYTFLLAKGYEAKGRPGDAARLYMDVLISDPSAVEAARALAAILIREGKTQRAEAILLGATRAAQERERVKR